MNLEFSKVFIQSKNPQLLASFFSELLDQPVHEQSDGYELEDSRAYPFHFFHKNKNSKKPLDQVFLYVEDLEELDELKQKVTFFVTGIS